LQIAGTAMQVPAQAYPDGKWRRGSDSCDTDYVARGSSAVIQQNGAEWLLTDPKADVRISELE